MSPAYFRALRAAPAAGRLLLDEDDGAPGAHPVAILSDRLWRRRFGGNPSMLGAFRNDARTRAEFLDLINHRRVG